MKKIISALLGTLMVFAVVAEADAKSRSGGFSSSRSSFSSRSYSKPKPVVRSAPKYTAPRAAMTKPVSKQSVVVSKPMVSRPVANTTFKRTPVRKVTSPIATRKATIVQKNYYGSRYNGYGNSYNRYGGGYGNSYGGGSGMGSSIMGSALGTFGGLMFYNAVFGGNGNGEDHSQPDLSNIEQPTGEVFETGEQAQVEPNPYEPQDNFIVEGVNLPADAPLMMNPKYYQQ